MISELLNGLRFLAAYAAAGAVVGAAIAAVICPIYLHRIKLDGHRVPRKGLREVAAIRRRGGPGTQRVVRDLLEYRDRILASPAWGSPDLAEDRLRVNLDGETEYVIRRLARIVKAAEGASKPDQSRPVSRRQEGRDRLASQAWELYDANTEALRDATASLGQRVDALRRYADTLDEVAQAQRTLSSLEANERAVGEISEIILATSGDHERVQELEELRARAAAQRDVLRSCIDMLVQPVEELARQADQ